MIGWRGSRKFVSIVLGCQAITVTRVILKFSSFMIYVLKLTFANCMTVYFFLKVQIKKARLHIYDNKCPSLIFLSYKNGNNNVHLWIFNQQ